MSNTFLDLGVWNKKPLNGYIFDGTGRKTLGMFLLSLS